MSKTKLPGTMRALVLASREGELPRPVLQERPLPVPRRGEVLVKIGAAPINPNDLLFLQDRYEVKKDLPVVCGFEGSGTVVASGGGFMASMMVGRRVACAAGEGDGTWAEYAAVPAMQCAPLRGGIDLDAGATMLTNPMTAWVLASRAEGHGAVVVTAAAGALGQMLNRLFRRQGRTVISVVRKKSQVDALTKDGAAHVLDSTAPGFLEELRALATKHQARLALDAVGGEMTGQLFSAMPDESIVRVYGMLANAPSQIDGKELVFKGKRLEGFTMYEWLRHTSMLGQLLAIMKVQGLLQDVLHTKVRARLPLEKHEEALTMAKESATDGKVLLVP